jgi:hypothetical protein
MLPLQETMKGVISSKVVEEFLKRVPWTNVFKKAVTAIKGQRLYPARNEKNDRSHNFRIDKGADVNGAPELILQANKNAENKGVREAAQKDSHAILAKVIVDVEGDPDGDKASEGLVESFKEGR